jgi:hypothetical protein
MAAGSRICTEAEILSTNNLGCNYDNKKIWTNSAGLTPSTASTPKLTY